MTEALDGLRTTALEEGPSTMLELLQLPELQGYCWH